MTSPDHEALSQLADQLHLSITKTFDDWATNADAPLPGTTPKAAGYSKPVTVPPVRMEQLARVPEPTADLDDLVDLLVPRLLEKLVPALKEALGNDDPPPTNVSDEADRAPRRVTGPTRLRE